jgi:hypothetical protein
MTDERDIQRARAEGLALHEGIRRAIARVLELGQGVKLGDHACCLPLTDAMKELAYEVRRHVAAEQADVMPLLAEVDAWGNERQDQLKRDHEAEIEAVFNVDYYGSHLAMADEATAIAHKLLRALKHEEDVVLSAGNTLAVSDQETG